MKKIGVVFLCLLLFVNLISIISSQDLQDSLEGVQDKVDNTRDKVEDVKDMDKWEYLSQEWDKILREKESFAPFIEMYDSLRPVFSPFFKYSIGVELELSFLFFLSLILGIALLVNFYRIFHNFSTFTDNIARVISIAMILVLGNFGFIKMFSEWIIKTIEILTSWWVKLLAVFVVYVVLILASIFSKEIEQFFKNLKKRREKTKEELKKMETEFARQNLINLSNTINRSLEDR